jgi:hypothetical protein
MNCALRLVLVWLCCTFANELILRVSGRRGWVCATLLTVVVTGYFVGVAPWGE